MQYTGKGKGVDHFSSNNLHPMLRLHSSLAPTISYTGWSRIKASVIAPVPWHDFVVGGRGGYSMLMPFKWSKSPLECPSFACARGSRT